MQSTSGGGKGSGRSTYDRALTVTLAWTAARLDLPASARLTPVLLSAVFVTVLAGWVYGLAIVIAYLAWFTAVVVPALRQASRLATALEPATEVFPEGLYDTAVTAAMLDHSDEGPSRHRVQRLASYAAANFTADGRAIRTNCADGHTALCEHRVSAEAAKFWGLVGVSAGA